VEKTAYCGDSCFVLTKYYSDNQMKKDTYGRGMWHECGTGGVHRRFWCGNLLKRDHSEDLGIRGMIILKWVLKLWEGDMD
jgi:hypothetical protein